MIGVCSRCLGAIFRDPLDEDRWRCDCAAPLNPVLGTVLTADAALALWDGVRRRRKDYVEVGADEAEAELDEIVPPELPMVEVDLDDAAVPSKARTMALAAMHHGWTIGLTRTRGTPLTAHGKSKAETVREYLTGEGGRPELSPTGKPRFRNVSTGRPLVVDCVALRMARDGVRLVAWWDDGKLGKCLRGTPLTILNDKTIRELIAS